ncbi:MAG: alkaline phosphatase family protein [Propionibacteriaceae bacterium]
MLLLGVSACTAAQPQSAATPPIPGGSDSMVPQARGKKAGVLPPPDHIVVVIFENEHRSSVIGSPQAPYLNELAAQGANLTHSYGITHPSQPNYLALFSGSTQGVTSDACPQQFPTADNLGHQLRTAGLSFTGYAESLPQVGYAGCGSGDYRRKHNPWVNFLNLPASVNRPFSDFPSAYRKLPTVSFVSPNMCHSMHDCPISTGDRWMQQHLDGYARWATGHNSWLIVTFDENAGGTVNPIPTIILGDHVRPGSYAQKINHYTLLRTIEDAYGLPALGNAAAASPLSKI